MSIKMKELTTLSGVPKATILYYIKEGLLPPPQKPKPNVHLYSKQSIEILDFISYLQDNFSCSIHEIKEIISSYDYNVNSSYEMLLDTIDIIMGSKHQQTYTLNEFLTKINITKDELQSYIDNGLIFLRDGLFTQKELDIVNMILNFKDFDIDIKLLKLYVKQARELASLEIEMVQNIIKKPNNSEIKKMFNILLILKPYIYNMTTLREYQKRRR